MAARGAALALTICAVLAARAAAEDLSVVYEVRGLVGKKTVTEEISGARVRIRDGSFDTLFDTAAKRMTVVDRERKSYWEASLDELLAHARSLPTPRTAPGATAAPAQPATSAAAPPPTLSKQAGSRVVAGLECDLYTLTGGGHSLEVCAARELQAPAHAAARRLEALGMGPSALPLDALYALLAEQVPGLPLAEKRTGASGRVESRQYRQALEVKRGDLPPSSFEVPAGYTRVESPLRAQPRRAPAAGAPAPHAP